MNEGELNTMTKGVISKALGAVALSGALLLSCAGPAMAYDAEKTAEIGMVRGDLSTWTQRGESFEENREISVNGSSPLSRMGCSYYATFFMLCKMGLKSQLTHTAWEFAMECSHAGLAREGTGYFDPRSIDELTNGRAVFVEEGNYDNYYDGQAAVSQCSSTSDVIKLLRNYTQKKGYFCVVCCLGTVTNYQGAEYNSAGHYIFVDQVLDNDLVIGDPAFPGTRWSENWGAHGASIVKIYCYKLLDDNGDQIYPNELQSMYIVRSFEDD